jgi:hypothetical protein
MSFTELILTLVQRPGYLGVLADRRIIRLNEGGYIMDATQEKPNYIRLNTTDCLAMTWEAWTAEQLAAMARAQEQG